MYFSGNQANGTAGNRAADACAWALIICCAAFAQQRGYGDEQVTYPGYPNWEERCILVLTNACRTDPVGFRNVYVGDTTILKPQNYPAVAPLYWNIGLNRSARYHAIDMANNCGMQHPSCNGTPWDTRIKSYYTKSGTIGENIATGGATPLDAMNIWLKDGNPPAADNSGSDGHRANIMSSMYRELGTGYAYGPKGYNYFWVQDFGGGTNEYANYPVTAGVHLFLESKKTTFMANYLDKNGKKPAEAAVFIDGVKQALSLFLGSGARGTYSFTSARGSACRKYYFSFIDSSGNTWRYPEYGDLVTCGEGTCTQEYAAPATFIKDRGILKESGPNARFCRKKTGIMFYSQSAGGLALEIFACNGQRVYYTPALPGQHTAFWPCFGQKGLPQGMYIARLNSTRQSITLMVPLVR